MTVTKKSLAPFLLVGTEILNLTILTNALIWNGSWDFQLLKSNEALIPNIFKE